MCLGMCVCTCACVCSSGQEPLFTLSSVGYGNQTSKMSAKELWISHTYTGSLYPPTRPNTHALGKGHCLTPRKCSPQSDKCCGWEFQQHSVQKLGVVCGDESTAGSRVRSLRQVGAVPQPVQTLLGILDQVLHAAVQGNGPHEQIQVVEEFQGTERVIKNATHARWATLNSGLK